MNAKHLIMLDEMVSLMISTYGPISSDDLFKKTLDAISKNHNSPFEKTPTLKQVQDSADRLSQHHHSEFKQISKDEDILYVERHEEV